MGTRTMLLGLLTLVLIPTSFGGGNGGGTPDPSQGAFAPHVDGQESLPALLMVEVLPHAPRDNEFVVIANPGREPINGRGWTLTDDEGSWTLPAVRITPGRTILITRNSTALWEDAGWGADACVFGCPAALAKRGSLALRNEGDGLQLLDPAGRTVDAYLYGDASPIPGWRGLPAPGLAKGLVARRQLGDEGWLDTNTSADWLWNRTFRLGQSRRPPASFHDVPVLPLLSPDDALEKLVHLLDRARLRIELAGFTLTNPLLVEALRDALDRGVRVQIGLEASPPGSMGSEGERILTDLQLAGARILLMGSHGEGAWRRYAFHHAKYIVIDERRVVLGSENFSSNGFPTGPGNRGWTVAVQDPLLAGWFGQVWMEDWDENRSDVRALPGATGPRNAGDPLNLPTGLPASLARVTAFLAPDNAAAEEGLLDVLLHARDRIDVEMFYLRWTWGETLNPFVAGLFRAADRGVALRILLDGQPYNVAEAEDNDEAVRRLNRLAAERGLPLEARLFPGDPQGVVKVHNKGVLVDGRQVWVSSMNWNEPGAYANREAALLVESPEVAAVFQQAFDVDWKQGAALGVPLASLGGDLLLWIGLGSGAAAGAWWWVLRTKKEATNKHPRKGKMWRRRLKQRSSPSRRRRSRSTRTAR